MGCMYACMHVCMYACMHVCMYACMHVCMYACCCSVLLGNPQSLHKYSCVCVYVYVHTHTHFKPTKSYNAANTDAQTLHVRQTRRARGATRHGQFSRGSNLRVTGMQTSPLMALLTESTPSNEASWLSTLHISRHTHPHTLCHISFKIWHVSEA
jgi:hypothetical protein